MHQKEIKARRKRLMKSMRAKCMGVPFHFFPAFVTLGGISKQPKRQTKTVNLIVIPIRRDPFSPIAY
jgi:hypothetical protein